MAVVFVTTAEEADYKIIKARLPKEADVTICEVTDEPSAAGQELNWLYSSQKEGSDFSIAWVEDPAQADFTIWKTVNFAKAKWTDPGNPLAGTLLK